nr:NAD-dependent protein deacetylase sirtuin-3, mitochondrial isoform X2 [Anolis sagrei ordinatus]
MNWRLHFRVSVAKHVLRAASFERLMGWRYFWICAQQSHYKNSFSSIAHKNMTLISLRPNFSPPNGHVLLQRIPGDNISKMSSMFEDRSPGSGLYSNLQQYNIPYPEAIFELNYFFHNPKPFFLLSKELYPGNYRPNYAHYFLRLLYDKGILLRLYTQNIDGLERVAGIPPDKLVEAHGTYATATCTVCRRSYPGEDFRGDVMAEKIPKCPVCTGIIKPDIVFFGEELPHRFFLHVTDFPMADLLFIIGTSLEVEPFASLAGTVHASVPRVLINRDLVGPFAYQPQHNDVAELGDVISGVERVVELLGWKAELQELMKKEKEKLDVKDK